jgi:hypothetical protein
MNTRHHLQIRTNRKFFVLLAGSFAMVTAGSLFGGAEASAPPKAPDKPPVTAIMLTQTRNGWGAGEAFKLKLQSNGNAFLTRGKSHPQTGEDMLTGTISKERFASLAKLLETEGFFTLKPDYPMSRTDQAVTSIGVQVGGEKGKTSGVVTHGDAPPAFNKIVGALREAKDSIPWKPAPKKSPTSGA